MYSWAASLVLRSIYFATLFGATFCEIGLAVGLFVDFDGGKKSLSVIRIYGREPVVISESGICRHAEGTPKRPTSEHIKNGRAR